MPGVAVLKGKACPIRAILEIKSAFVAFGLPLGLLLLTGASSKAGWLFKLGGLFVKLKKQIWVKQWTL